MALGLTNPVKGLLYILIYVLGFQFPFLSFHYLLANYVSADEL
ncbi:hypothetical protein BFZC1_15043 [Lysinibacillus fusiformis ZC1]|nr:hypothetical protein BFZC1_15043 [Lysinibacillus fusiformis ZC1]